MELHRCPRCGRSVHRSRSRNRFEAAAKRLLPVKTYRCLACGWRGFRWTGLRRLLWGPRGRPRRSSLLLLVVVGVAALLVTFLHRRIVDFVSPPHDESTAEPTWEEPPADEEPEL